jgi:hypothetical protein
MPEQGMVNYMRRFFIIKSLARHFELKNILNGRVAEGKFGTEGAIAPAFVTGFQP